MIASNVAGKVQQYMDGVLDGSIVASKRVKEAVRRQIRDLERQSTDEFPYHFDTLEAESVCEYFPCALRHSTGRFARKPFELSPFQLFITWVLFGWKSDIDNTRRFRRAYISMARKGGKSSYFAGIAHFMASEDIDPATGRQEAVAEVLLTATKKDQADIIYSECLRMREQSELIAACSDPKNYRITYFHNKGYITKLGSDRPFDGKNPHCVIIDEFHEWKEVHRPFYDTMTTGSGSRTQPLIAIITTAGTDESYLWIAIYDYSCQVVSGIVQDETIFVFIAELDDDDDPADESTWAKANPNLGVSNELGYLQQQWNEFKHTAVGRNRFMRYHGNRRVSSNSKAFDMVQWDSCAGELSNWADADAIAGAADVGGQDDLAAYAYVARFEIGREKDVPIYRYEAKIRAYIDDEASRDLTKNPFAEWIYRDIIRKRKFAITEMKTDFIEECAELGVYDCAFDPHNAKEFSNACLAAGINAASMPQSTSHFNEPIKSLFLAIKQGRFRHDGNELLRWCANNAVLYTSRKDESMFDKKHSSEKIDPVVAMTMAFRVCQNLPSRPKSAPTILF